MNPPHSHAAPEPGDSIGRWAVQHWVGVGTYAHVYKVEREDLPGLAGALKWGRHAQSRESFAREVRALGQVDHAGIVRLIEHDLDAEPPWLITSWARGRPLDALGRVPLGQSARIALSIARAVEHVHERGLAHGDIKPCNARIDDVGRVLLLDFGSSVPGSSSSRLRVTPRYAPPEWFGEQGVDPRSADVYALGVLLLELFIGGPAFSERGLDAIARLKRSGPLSHAGLPVRLADVVTTCTQVDPSLRPSSSELCDLLETMADDEAHPLVERTLAPAARAFVPAVANPRFTLVEELGRGGMGVVYRAWDAHLARYVALKRPPLDAIDLRRFTREARLAASLRHPGIVQVLDIQLDDPAQPSFTMALVEGTDLRRRLEIGPMPSRAAAQLGRQVADALAHAHSAGLTHRDVKPANILLDLDGRAHLADFGVAQANDDRGDRLTRTGEIVGTLAYMPPEQAAGRAVGPAADVYALCAVLYEAISGAPPQVQSDGLPFARLRQVAATVPAPLEAIVALGLLPDPTSRPSARELALDLDRYLAGEPVLATHPGPLRRLRHHLVLHRRAWTAAALGLSIGALLLAGGGAYLRLERAQAELRRTERAQERWSRVRSSLEALRGNGRADEADLVFVGFVSDSGRITPSVRVDAWLWEAARLEEAGELDPALDAVAEAWLSADARTGQRVLEPMQRLLMHAAHLEGAARLPGAMSGHEIAAGVRQQAAFLRRDLALAAHLSGVLGPVASALSAAEPVAVQPRSRVVIGQADDQPGVEVIAHHSDFSIAVHTSEPGLPLRLIHRPAHARTRWHAAGGRIVEGVHVLPTTRLLTLADDKVQEVGVIEGAGAFAAAVDPEESDALWLARNGGPASLHRWTPDGGVQEAWPALALLGGDVDAIAVGDFDHDGQFELAVPSGQWSSFEIWVLDRDDAGAWGPAASALVGYTPDLAAAVRPEGGSWIVTAGRQDFGSRSHFPVGSPYGLDPGVHAFSLNDGEIVHRASIAARGNCARLTTGDIDGDGVDEVIATCDEALVIGVATPAGYAVARLDRLLLQGVGDLDGDGDDEIVVTDLRDDSAWVLGRGQRSLPTHEPAELDVTCDLPDDPDVHRAIGLSQVSLWASSARALQGLAAGRSPLGAVGETPSRRSGVAPTAAKSGARNARSGKMKRQGAGDPALKRSGAGSTRTLLDGERLLRCAAALLERGRRPSEAIDVLQRAPASAETLAALLVREGRPHQARMLDSTLGAPGSAPATLTFDGQELPRQVLVLRPAAMRWSRRQQTLELAATPDSTPILQLPLQAVEPLRAEVRLRLTRVDWHAHLAMTLVDAEGDRVAQLSIHGRGGARLTHAEIHAAAGERETPVVHRWRFEGEPAELVLRLAQEPDGWRFDVDVNGVRYSQRVAGPTGVPVRLELSSSEQRVGTAVIGGSLRAIEVEGARLFEQPDHPERSIVAGRAPLSDDPWLAALAADNAGDTAGAAQLAAELWRQGRAPRLPDALAGHHGHWLPIVRDALGPDWLELFADAHLIEIRSGVPTDRRDSLLLSGLTDADLSAVPEADRLAVASWIALCADAHLRAGRPAVAHRMLDRAEQLAGDQAIASTRAARAVQRARVHLAMGERDLAIASLKRAVLNHPVPSRLRRQLLQGEEWAPLHADPWWAERIAL